MLKSWIISTILGRLNLFIWIIILINNNNVNKIECDDTEYKLIHSILDNYDSSIRPSDRHNSTLNVTFGLALTQLIDVDERNMIITTNCWLTQDWIDSNLRWDPTKFNNIKFVHIPADKLWKPDILLVNNADVWARISVISTNAIVKYTGNVTWLSAVIFKSACSINVRYFPFDEQVCDMIFASWTFDGYFIDINVNSGEGDTTNYIKNGEWHLVKLLAIKNLKKYSCCEEPYPEIVYKLIIRRRPLYYLFNMVFPCLLITLVAFFGFYLPPGSTEKVSIGITTLLSITVFLMMVAESMPPTSEQLPLLSIYYAVTIGIVSCSTAMAVITLNINNKGYSGRRVPRIIKIIFFNYIAKVLRTKLVSIKKAEHYKSGISELQTETNNNNNMVQKKLSSASSSTAAGVHKNQIRKKVAKKDYYENFKKKKPIEVILTESLNENSKITSINNNKLMLVSMPQYQNLSSTTTYNNNFLVSKMNLDSDSDAAVSADPDDADTPIWTQNGDSSIHASSILYCDNKNTSSKINKTDLNNKKQDSHYFRLGNIEFLNELSKLLEKQFNPLVRNILKIIERNDKILQEKNRLDFIQSEWSDISKICDHLMCYFFPILTISTCCIIFLNSPHTLPLSQW